MRGDLTLCHPRSCCPCRETRETASRGPSPVLKASGGTLVRKLVRITAHLLRGLTICSLSEIRGPLSGVSRRVKYAEGVLGVVGGPLSVQRLSAHRDHPPWRSRMGLYAGNGCLAVGPRFGPAHWPGYKLARGTPSLSLRRPRPCPWPPAPPVLPL